MCHAFFEIPPWQSTTDPFWGLWNLWPFPRIKLCHLKPGPSKFEILWNVRWLRRPWLTFQDNERTNACIFHVRLQAEAQRIHGTGIFTIIYPHLVGFHGIDVGKYTSAMDPSWVIFCIITPRLQKLADIWSFGVKSSWQKTCVWKLNIKADHMNPYNIHLWFGGTQNFRSMFDHFHVRATILNHDICDSPWDCFIWLKLAVFVILSPFRSAHRYLCAMWKKHGKPGP